MNDILLNKLLTGELLIYTKQPKNDNARTIQNKVKKTRDKKTRQCNRYRLFINYINNNIDKNKKEAEND